MTDIERFETETAQFERDLSELQVKAADAELGAFCKKLRLAHWEAPLRRANFHSILQLKTAYKNGR